MGDWVSDGTKLISKAAFDEKVKTESESKTSVTDTKPVEKKVAKKKVTKKSTKGEE